MLLKEPLLVLFVKLIDRVPLPEAAGNRSRGREKTYSDRLILKALVIMIVRRLYTAYSLLAFLEQPSALTVALRACLTEAGRFPSRRTWERRLAALPESLPGLIGCFGRFLVAQLQPWGQDGQAAAIDSTALRAKGGSGTRKTAKLASCPIPPLTPKPTGPSLAIMAGGMAGSCIWSAPWQDSGFRWPHN